MSRKTNATRTNPFDSLRRADAPSRGFSAGDAGKRSRTAARKVADVELNHKRDVARAQLVAIWRRCASVGSKPLNIVIQ